MNTRRIRRSSGTQSPFGMEGLRGSPVSEQLEVRIMADASLPLVVISVPDRVCTEKDADQGRFTITRFGNTEQPLRVNFQITGTATPGEDYLGLRPFATIPAGRRSVSLPIIPIDDLTDEPGETVRITLADDAAYRRDTSNPLNVSLALVIKDNDDLPLVTLGLPDASVTELGNNSATISVRRTGPVDLPLTVDFRIAGSATPGTDYESFPPTITIPAGRRAAFITINALNDAFFEGNETVRLTLEEPSDGRYRLKTDTPSQFRKTVFIQDRPVVSIIVTDPLATSFPADTAEFTIFRSGPTNEAMQVAYQLEGTAIAGTDYALLPQFITIPAGSSFTRVIIQGLNTDLSAASKTVRLTLRQQPTYNLNMFDANSTSAYITIIDDRVPPGV